jgi:hypothetical protein
MGGARGSLEKQLEDEIKAQVDKIQKIKNQKSGNNPEKTEKVLKDFLAKQELEKLKAPRQSPR